MAEAEKIEVSIKDALIIVDPQNDFCPGGKLAVEGGDEIMKKIAELSKRYETVIITQDWHPEGHSSFASQHEGKNPFEVIDMPYGPQVLWPDHCIQGSEGAEFHPDILPAVERAQLIIRKGMNPEIDSYSAFTENDQVTVTGLGGLLRSKRLRRCVFVGLAYDYCVGFSALDAFRNESMQSIVLRDLTRAIDPKSVDEMNEQFRINNIIVIDSGDLT